MRSLYFLREVTNAILYRSYEEMTYIFIRHEVSRLTGTRTATGLGVVPFRRPSKARHDVMVLRLFPGPSVHNNLELGRPRTAEFASITTVAYNM